MCLGSFNNTVRAEDAQAAFTSTLQSQAAEVFGNDDKVWNQIQSTAAPLFAAGPSQQGFSAAEQNAKNALAITQGANAQRFAAAAAKSGEAGFGGGNALNISGAGANAGADIRAKIAAQTSAQLENIQEQNWETGRENWKTAGEMIEKSPGVFQGANQFDSAIQGGLDRNLQAAKSRDAAGNWWVKPLEGAVGAGLSMIPGAGPVLGAGMKGLTGGGGGGGMMSMFGGGMANVDTTGGSSFGEKIGQFFGDQTGNTPNPNPPNTGN